MSRALGYCGSHDLTRLIAIRIVPPLSRCAVSGCSMRLPSIRISNGKDSSFSHLHKMYCFHWGLTLAVSRANSRSEARAEAVGVGSSALLGAAWARHAAVGVVPRLPALGLRTGAGAGYPHPGRRTTPRRWLVRAPSPAPGGLGTLLTGVRATRHTAGAGRVESPGSDTAGAPLRGGPRGAGCRAEGPTRPAPARGRHGAEDHPPAWAPGDALPRGHTRHGLQAPSGVARAPPGGSDWACGTPGEDDTPPSPAHPQASGPGTDAPPPLGLGRPPLGHPRAPPAPEDRAGATPCAP